jgi:hypothetical protein
MRCCSLQCVIIYARIYYKCMSVCMSVCVCVCVCVFSIIRGIVDAVNNTARALIVTLKLKGIGRTATEIVDGGELVVVGGRWRRGGGCGAFCLLL